MPEKTLTEISRDLRALYEKGNAAMQRDNLDYAITIYNEILQQDPAFFECRQTLRQAQIRKHGSQTSFFKRMIGNTASSPLMAKGQVQLRTNPKDAMATAEQILNGDPSSSVALKLLADAALALDLPKTAVAALEIVHSNKRGDRDVALSLATAYIAANQAFKAEKIYQDLKNANPNDQEIGTLLKNLSATRTMDEKGYEKLADGKGSYRDILKDKTESVNLEQEQKQMRSEEVLLRMIDEHIDRLQRDPADFKLARQLAELYSQVKDYRKATSYYRQLLAIEGVGDSAMESRYAELMISYFNQQIDQLDSQAPDYAERAAQLTAEKDQFVLDEAKRRVDKYPNDLQIRYDYAVQLFKNNRIQEAIPEFQKATKNPNRAAQATYYLGQCFALQNKNDLAVKQIQNALKEKVGFDDEKKEMVYALGSVFEKMGKKDEAFQQFLLIYEVDVGYRDVQTKVDAYYDSRGTT